MDSIDHKIVDLLAINCRMSLQELSSKTGVSANEVNRRIEVLLKTGVIRSFIILLSPLLTNEELSIAILDFDKVPKEMELIGSLEKNPSVWRVYRSLEEKYVIFSIYFDQEELMELSLTLRRLPGIGHVDVYSRFLRYWGGKIELTNVHKQILRCLAEDARMSIADIARKTGLESNAVTNSINQLNESETVLFTVDASDYLKESKIEILAKVQWNVGKTSQEHVSKWLQNSFSSIYLREFVSVSEPTLFFDFTVNHVQEVAVVKKKSIESGIISEITPLILFPGTLFKDPRIRKLDELLTETGFS